MNESSERPIKIGNYVIIGELGRGGMGVVYLAQDLALGRQIAIKVLPPELAGEPVALKRFRREAKLLASMSHPNIATVYSFEESHDLHYITLEVIKGCTLAERLAAGPLDQDLTFHVCRQVLAALETAHGKGIIHRDLKPSNIMLTENDQVKVLDFGLAKVATDEPTKAVDPTVTGATLGTTGYASPEQLRGAGIDHRTDIWSLGCILFECLTGDRLFGDGSQAERIAATLDEAPKLNTIPKDCPQWLLAILESCLAKQANSRPSTAREVRLKLLAGLRNSSDSTRPSSTESRRPSHTSANHRSNTMRRQVVRATIILGAVVLGVLGVRELALSNVRVETNGYTVSATSSILGEVWSHTHTSEICVQKKTSWSSPLSVAYGLSHGQPDGGNLYVRNARTGNLLWSAQLDSTLLRQVYGAHYTVPQEYECRDIVFADLDGDKRDELIAAWQHHLWWPGCAFIYDENGRLLGYFLNLGRLTQILPVDLNADGRQEILLAGNNCSPAYRGATLILLDSYCCRGAARDSLALVDCELEDDSAIRVIFPGFEQRYMDLLNTRQLTATHIEVTPQGPHSMGIVCYLGAASAPLIIRLDSALRPLDVRATDAFIEAAAFWPEEDRTTFLSAEHLNSWLDRHYRYNSLLYECKAPIQTSRSHEH